MRTKFILVFAFAALALCSYGQGVADGGSSVKAMLDAKRFTFKAQSMTPLRAGVRQLNGPYTLALRGDTLVCDLPYMGRQYQADYGSSDGGLKFTSTSFDYKITEKKKSRVVDIRVKDQRNQPRFFLTVYDNSNAMINATCSDRQAISYNGVILSPAK